MPEVIALYIVAPMFGGLLAAIVYGILGTKEKHTHEHKEVEEEKHHHHKSVDELNLDTLVASES
jgi:phosphate/sulfate permease